MDKKELKKIVAGLGIAGLIGGGVVISTAHAASGSGCGASGCSGPKSSVGAKQETKKQPDTKCCSGQKSSTVKTEKTKDDSAKPAGTSGCGGSK